MAHSRKKSSTRKRSKKISRRSFSITKKAKQFNEVLQAAKRALDSVNVRFHLHAGTALGAHREHSFIEHDDDIDLAVFYKDVDTIEKAKAVKHAMENEGFEVYAQLGKINRGFEFKFSKNDISLDIFWVYPGEYRGKKYFILSSYYGDCNKYKYKTCVWGYSPYNVEKVKFLGEKYEVVPKKTLVDMYGKDWEIPKKFDYFEGVTQGGYTGLIQDYYEPITPKKIAYCFLLYDTVKHNKIWEKYFNQDKFPVKSYSIYSHLKSISEKTPEWIKKNKIRTIKTEWCEENLVHSWVNMLKKAYKDENNKYFVLLSGDCIPLYDYWRVHKKITSSSKSRINIDYGASVYYETGLLYADQWVVLNRKCAKLLIDLRDTEAGKEYMRYLKSAINVYCPDEVYPVNWFVKKFGKPSSERFKKEIRNVVTTYTQWSNDNVSPDVLDVEDVKKLKGEICKSKAIFGRKFTKEAAEKIAMSC